MKRIPQLTLTQLGYAVAVDDHRHFAQAAASCNVSQPTLSTQLQKLERELSTVLFDRSRTPVVPTEAGVPLLAQARLILRESSRLGELTEVGRETLAGELRVGVIPTLAPYLLPAVVETLAARHPQLELVVEERVTGSLLEAIRDDRLDAGLVASTAESTEVVGRTLFREPFFGYVSAGHRLAGRATLRVADLSLDDLWLLSEGHCLRAQAVTLCRQRRGGRDAARANAGCTRVARFESGNLETLKGLVERGMGMTLLPALATAGLRERAGGAVLIPFADPAPGRVIRLVRRRRQLREQLVRAFVSVVRDVMPTAGSSAPR